jgi:hypothetical protein
MSDVFSFRLSDENPREAQAREVIDAWVKQGYSLRHVMTEALILLGKHGENSDYISKIIIISELVERFSKLLDKIESAPFPSLSKGLEQIELKDSFVSSIKLAAKPGMRINL